MQNHNHPFQSHPYSLPIEMISGIRFTPREIDILACILGRRTAKKIAFFLSISSKTVENHIRNIMQKLECNSRESIIEFIENCEEFQTLQKHYANLLIYGTFKKCLHEIANIRGKTASSNINLFLPQEKDLDFIYYQLSLDLQEVGISLQKELLLPTKDLTSLLKQLAIKTEEHILCFLPQNLYKEFFYSQLYETFKTRHLSHDPNENQENIFLLFWVKGGKSPTLKNIFHLAPLDSEGQQQYYSSIFDLLATLFSTIELKDLHEKFKRQCDRDPPILEVYQAQTEPIIKAPKTLFSNLLLKAKALLRTKIGKLLAISLSFLIIGVSTSVFLFNSSPDFQRSNQKLQEAPTHQEVSIRSDLIVPTETAFLNRPELIAEMDEKLKGKEGIQAIALIGIGGAGKTTLAREYAYQQNASVIWEINAETHASLIRSFEALAYALYKNDKNKNPLYELQEIKNPTQREEKLFSLIQEKFHFLQNWILIYDSATNFGIIKKYFPHDQKVWGNGKIIITTQDSNFQNNIFVRDAIFMGELTGDQKLNLFLKLIHKTEHSPLTSEQIETMKKFLDEIPSFPLDISIAAYYLKATQISYDNYLNLLKNFNKEFLLTQEHLLQEIGEYAKTRYNIISISLQQLINTHKNFRDLLLFTTLLNSQHIPIDLLDNLKDNSVVNNFIYNLKRYSFITEESSQPSLVPTFSMHRSIHNMSLNHLKQLLNLDNYQETIQPFIAILEAYTEDTLEKEDLLKIKLLASHYETLIRNNWLSEDMIAALKTELGGIYYHIGDSKKAKEILEENILYYSKKNNSRLGRTLAYLGISERVLGHPQKAIDILEKSLSIYKDNFPTNKLEFARLLSYLGVAYYDIGNYEKAQILLEQSISVYENLSKAYPGKGWALALLGNVYRELGQFEKAKSLVEKSLAFSQEHFAHERSGFSRNLTYLGNVYKDLGHYEKARQTFEKALTLCKEEYGDKSSRTAWTLVHLGHIYRELKDYRKAKELLQKAFQIYKENYGSENFNTLWVSSYLGCAYRDAGEYKLAKGLLEKSLIAYEERYGKNHIQTARILRDLGKVYLLEEDIKVAEEYFNNALEIFSQNDHPEQYACFDALSDLYLQKARQAEKQGELSLALTFKGNAQANLQQALEIIRNRLPSDSPHLIRIQEKLRAL